MMRWSAGLVTLGIILLGCQLAFSDGAEPNLVPLPIGIWPLAGGFLAIVGGLLIGLIGGTPRYRLAALIAVLGSVLVIFAFQFLYSRVPSASAPMFTINDVALLLGLVSWAVAIVIGARELRSAPAARDIR